MKNFKVLPLTIAVASSLAAMSSFAATDADVAALEARIAELETRTETIAVNVQEQNVLPADITVPSGIIFSGYARYGAAYANGDKKLVNVGTTGRSVGRLGNEDNGGEVQLAKLFEADNGAKWNVVFMADHWESESWADDGGLSMKKMYAGVTNVFESQPDLYMWAGRDFHQRPQQGLNDYFWMTHDGQGAGFNNLNLGGAKLDMGFVGQVKGGLVNDNGKYAITSKLHSIDAGIGNLDLYANYGFASDDAGNNDVDGKAFKDINAWQVGAVLGLGDSNRIILRYGEGADDSVFNLMDDSQIFYGSFEGNYAVSDNFIIDYLASYKDMSGDSVRSDKAVLDDDDEPTGVINSINRERSEYSVIVRPQYQWNDVHSTWLEAGYAIEDYKNGDEVSGWKVTLSQNVSLGGLPWSRPMLRFYATVGDVDYDQNTFDDKGNVVVDNDKYDTVTFGAMFEAWW